MRLARSRSTVAQTWRLSPFSSGRLAVCARLECYILALTGITADV